MTNLDDRDEQFLQIWYLPKQLNEDFQKNVKQIKTFEKEKKERDATIKTLEDTIRILRQGNTKHSSGIIVAKILFSNNKHVGGGGSGSGSGVAAVVGSTTIQGMEE